FLKGRGALNEASTPVERSAERALTSFDRGLASIPPEVVQRIPESVARENVIMPVAFDGETITIAAVDAENIALADKLRFLLAKNVRLVPAVRESILAAISRYYGRAETESVDSMLSEFTDTAMDFDEEATARRHSWRGSLGRHLAEGCIKFKKG